MMRTGLFLVVVGILLAVGVVVAVTLYVISQAD